MKVTDSPFDAVFVVPGKGQIELRIGVSEPGKSRFAVLKPREARLVAYALLSGAEQAEAAKEQ
jgi:hypothetical protein